MDEGEGVVCGHTFEKWLSEPLLRARDQSALRSFACRVARMGLSRCGNPPKEICTILEECEKWAGGLGAIREPEGKRQLIENAARLADERARKLNDAYDSGELSHEELDDSWTCARGYYGVAACLDRDALAAAADAIYEASWAFDVESVDDLRGWIEPLLGDLH